LVAPKEIPKQVAIITEDPAAFTLSQSTVGGVPGGVPGGAIGGTFGGIGAAPPPPPPPPPPPAPKAPPKEVGPRPIGGKIAEANRIKTVNPTYPQLAKQARIQGDVKFTAIISKDGTIQKLELVSGNPLLVQAAREAVVQWVYRPTMLNGEAVDVITDITVHFTLQ
jgi:protein TonB